MTVSGANALEFNVTLAPLPTKRPAVATITAIPTRNVSRYLPMIIGCDFSNQDLLFTLS